jgi:hypothetical protein
MVGFTRRRSAPSAGMIFLGAVLAVVVSPAALRAAGYRFILPTINALPGDRVRVTIQGEHEQSAQGFSIAARYPAADLTIERVHIEDTILEAIKIDYFEKKVLPDKGVLLVGILVDSQPPFEGNLIPNIGRPLDFIHLETKVSATALGDLRIRLENGLGDPPIDNLYAVNNQAVPVTELTEGAVRLPSGLGAAFLRGDFNMDLRLDISDPIGILSYNFFGQASPSCMLAGDANDDETVDISDPIFLLNFLFSHGRSPPPPSQIFGPDPTPGTLECLHPLRG